MIYNITLTANHQTLTAEYLPLAAESVQYLTAKVVCETEDWTGREIKAMFGQGCTVHEVSVTDGEITAKQQLNLTAGDWRVWLVGNSARDGEVIPRITTNVAHISVAPTGGTEGNPFPTIPPTAEEQLRADMGNLADLTTEDKSSLVAAINEAAESGGGGAADAVTYTPQTLTDEQQEQARENITVAKSYQIPTTTINDNEVRVDGWAALIGVGRPSGFSIILSDVLNGALPFFVANGMVFLCTGVDSSGAHKELTFVGFASSGSSLSAITYKNARWEDGIQVIYIYPGSVNPNDIDYCAKVTYYYVGSYGYIYGPSYKELMEERDFAVKHPLAVVNGKFDNAILPLTCVDDVNKSITYARIDVLPSGAHQIRGLTIADGQPLHIIDLTTPPPYTVPASGIPKADLAEDVQTSLAKADTAISLGLSAATPGQIIKVKAVQDGKPTEWEAVDMPSGDKWEKIKEITIAEDAEESNALTINADENGNAFRLKKARLCAKFPAYTGTSNIPNFSFAMLNGKTTGRVHTLIYTGLWPKISTNSITGTVYYVDVSGAQQIEYAQRSGNAGWSDDTTYDYRTYGSNYDQLGTIYGDTLWAKPITSIGGTGMLIYPGCHFVLYGVRE